jgi:cytochrome c oxidase cbb3-type subunit 4
MDVNELRIIVTLMSLVAFVGIVIWAWSSRNRESFEEAARLPFAEDPPATRGARGEGK